MKFMLSAAVATAALMVAGAASAQGMPTGVYGSLGYNHYSAEIEDADEDVNLGAIAGRVSLRTQPWLAVEGEAAIGIIEEEESGGGITATVGLNHDVGVYVVGLLPVSPQTDIFARLGYGLAELEVEISGGGLNLSETEDEQYVALGIGAQHFFDGVNGVRVDYTRMELRTDDSDEDGGSLDRLGIAYVRKF